MLFSRGMPPSSCSVTGGTDSGKFALPGNDLASRSAASND